MIIPMKLSKTNDRLDLACSLLIPDLANGRSPNEYIKSLQKCAFQLNPVERKGRKRRNSMKAAVDRREENRKRTTGGLGPIPGNVASNFISYLESFLKLYQGKGFLDVTWELHISQNSHFPMPLLFFLLLTAFPRFCLPLQSFRIPIT